MFSTTVHGKTINLYPADLNQILHVPTRGWSHYVKGACLPLDNLTSALDISRIFSGNPSLLTHRRVLKNEILIIKHTQRVLIQDANGHALPYEFWLAPVFEDFHISVKVWSLQTIKDVIGSVNHAILPAAMRSADNPMQRLRNALVAKQSEVVVAQAALKAAQAAHEEEKQVLQAQITSLTAILEKERANNADIIRKLTSLIPSSSST
ncbi:hypothetical protein P3S68_019754 [Capsicum galapagoense]